MSEGVYSCHYNVSHAPADVTSSQNMPCTNGLHHTAALMRAVVRERPAVRKEKKNKRRANTHIRR